MFTKKMSTLFLSNMSNFVVFVWLQCVLSVYDCMYGWSRQYQYKTADRRRRFSHSSVTQRMLDILLQEEKHALVNLRISSVKESFSEITSSLISIFLENIRII